MPWRCVLSEVCLEDVSSVRCVLMVRPGVLSSDANRFIDRFFRCVLNEVFLQVDCPQLQLMYVLDLGNRCVWFLLSIF